jgi:hypothetical protein
MTTAIVLIGLTVVGFVVAVIDTGLSGKMTLCRAGKSVGPC